MKKLTIGNIIEGILYIISALLSAATSIVGIIGLHSNNDPRIIAICAIYIGLIFTIATSFRVFTIFVINREREE